MQKLGLMVVGLVCAGALLCTQASVSAKAKTYKDQVKLTVDLKVGTTVLKPGDYRVTVDGSQITFTHLHASVDDSVPVVDSKFKPVSVPCQTKALPNKSEDTQLDTAADANGGTVLKGVLMRGSEVEFTVTN
jgi:hypothetical protein